MNSLDVLNTRDVDLGIDKYIKPNNRIYSNADGNIDFVTTKNTPAYYSVPIIIRDNIAGVKYNVGEKINGTPYPEKISVINNDGSDYASYDFIFTNINGKDVYINISGLKKISDNVYEVTSEQYPYFAENWINTRYIITQLPINYEFSGNITSIKTVTDSLSNPEVKTYVSGNINNKKAYVLLSDLKNKLTPIQQQMEKPSRNVMEAETITASPNFIKSSLDKAKAVDEAAAQKAKEEAEANSNKAIDELDSDKIFGIPKTGFWIGVGVIVVLGGYFGYKKYIVKK